MRKKKGIQTDMQKEDGSSFFLHRTQDGASVLIENNLGSGVAERLALSAPFMMLYEKLDLDIGHLVTHEISEKTNLTADIPLQDLLREMKHRQLHSHDYYEMTVVLSGQLHMRIGNHEHTFLPGEACFCNRNILHAEQHSSNFEIVLFMLREPFLQKLLQEDKNHQPKSRLFHFYQDFLQLFDDNEKTSFLTAKEYYTFSMKDPARMSEEILPSLTNIYRIMAEEIQNQSAGYYLFAKGLLLRLFFLLEDRTAYEVELHHLSFSKDELLFREISLLLEKHAGRISAAELQAQLNYNPDYINRIVKMHTGYSIAEYKHEFMLKKAAQLLLETNLSVQDICEELGYSNQTYFNRLFSEKYHITPGKYRRIHASAV